MKKNTIALFFAIYTFSVNSQESFVFNASNCKAYQSDISQSCKITSPVRFSGKKDEYLSSFQFAFEFTKAEKNKINKKLNKTSNPKEAFHVVISLNDEIQFEYTDFPNLGNGRYEHFYFTKSYVLKQEYVNKNFDEMRLTLGKNVVKCEVFIDGTLFKALEYTVNYELPKITDVYTHPCKLIAMADNRDKNLEEEAKKMITAKWKKDNNNGTILLLYQISENWKVDRDKYNKISGKYMEYSVYYKVDNEYKWRLYLGYKEFDGTGYGNIKYILDISARKYDNIPEDCIKLYEKEINK